VRLGFGLLMNAENGKNLVVDEQFKAQILCGSVKVA
jgi:hypothetical protein